MTPWARAELAVRLLAVDPSGLAGLWLRARSGPVRDRLTAALPALPLPQRRIHPQIDDAQLFGGLDVAATLGAGRAVAQAGVLDAPAALVLAMAERCPAGLAGRLATALDTGCGHTLVALDEGAEPDEALPAALADRLALHVDLDGVSLAEAREIPLASVRTGRLGAALPPAPAEALADLTVLAARLGIASLRAPALAVRAARAHAALAGRGEVAAEDLAVAAELVLGPRATQLPADAPDEADPPDAPPPEPPHEPEARDEDSATDLDGRPPEDMLVAAAQAALPRDLLAGLAGGRPPRASGGASGAGGARMGNRRGRPMAARPGRLGGGTRLDLVATLRTAAPWQPIRRAARAADAGPDAPPLDVRPSDFRIKRRRELSDRLVIFVVDASGSAAMTRLAEAKGAVELLLGEAYARRDHVALVSFRGSGAEVLLPPTRSLVQTKRRLAALPGGGGTPLAAGLSAARDLARTAAGRGMSPTIALITDGRANIALDGTANRAAAADDATRIARGLRADGIPALTIDLSPRPQPALQALSEALGAPYLPLPRADAGRLSQAVSAALPA